MADRQAPYWVLISILFSSLPMTPTLAMRLHQAAFDLYKRDEGVAQLPRGDVDLAQGEVRNLRRTVLLGSLAGPGFEAQLETERGHGVVRFLLTQQGIEHIAERQTVPAALN